MARWPPPADTVVSVPHHQQLAETLMSQIADGRFKVGERLPTEGELCATYGLARGTVRRGLGSLEHLGMITRRAGVGTTVIAPSPVAGYQPVAQSASDIATLAAETRLLKPYTGQVVADAELARRLGVRRGSTWSVIEGRRVRRRGDTTPVCWSEHYLRGDLPAEGLRRRDLTVEVLSRQRVEQTISAGLLQPRIAEALDAEPYGAALVITRRHRDQKGRMISVGVHTHPGDRYLITANL
jgi:GntR family transcriptional regulator